MESTQACPANPSKPFRPSSRAWLGASLAFSAVLAVWGLCLAFQTPWVVQDDARQHVFWMARFLDPTLFPHDPIAAYFQSVAPLGYRAIYRVAYFAGIDPFLFNKLLPLILGLVATYYCYRLCMLLFPHEGAAFLSSVILNLVLWIKDDLASGTPRAFVYALLIPFCYYVLKRSVISTAVLAALQGLIYPPILLISFCTLFLRLFTWENRRIRIDPRRRDFAVALAGLSAAILVLAVFSLELSHFGPVIKGSQARLMGEFMPGGRSEFFLQNKWDFFLRGPRSGYFPSEWFHFPRNIMLLLLILFPICLGMKNRLPLLKDLRGDAVILFQLFIAGSFLFVAAHVMLFKMHLPSRYPSYTFRLITAVGGGLCLSALMDKARRMVPATPGRHLLRRMPLVLMLFLQVAFVALIMRNPNFPKTSYIVGRHPELYRFLQTQPKDVCIASLSGEARNIPSFSQRKVLVASEYAIPYHLGYYLPFREKTRRLLQAQYTDDPGILRGFIQDYRVDLFVIDRGAFSPTYLLGNAWTNDHHDLTEPISRGLAGGMAPVLQRVLAICPKHEVDSFTIVSSRDILEALGRLQPGSPAAGSGPAAGASQPPV